LNLGIFQRALAILGEREVRRWIRLVATLGAGQGKTSDLVLAALVRVRFCELLSPKIAHGDSDLFLVGMISLLDSMREIPMHRVLDNVPIDQESKAALLGGGSHLRPFHQLMLAQESGEWKAVGDLTRQLHLTESDVASAHLQAMEWARQVTAGT
jgi:EAL and modified HD-GYP domain-containing signal transduction protein